jgi:hypothetical protein
VDVTWAFRVSRDAAGTSYDSSCETEISLPGPLDPPSNPQTNPPTESRQPGLTITWQAPQGRSVEGGRSQVQGYRVYRQADGDSTSQLVGRPTETRHVDQDVSESRSYTYEIYAADQYGVGRAAVVRVEGSAVGTSGGCASAAPVAAPLGLALA